MRGDRQTKGHDEANIRFSKFFLSKHLKTIYWEKNYSKVFEIITEVMSMLRKKSIEPTSHKNMLIKKFQILQQAYFVANSVSSINLLSE